jgi:putative phosphoesterase
MLQENMVGIISDTHDNRASIARAVELFNSLGCALVVHAGDFVAPFTYGEFANLEGRLIGVFGNNDGEQEGLVAQFAKKGGIFPAPHEFSWHGKRFVVMHKPSRLYEFIGRGDLDVVIYGHLHKIDIRRDKPLVVNPGECCAWLTGRSTVAALDLDTMHVEIHDLDL